MSFDGVEVLVEDVDVLIAEAVVILYPLLAVQELMKPLSK
jgi:hypothetical protein